MDFPDAGERMTDACAKLARRLISLAATPQAKECFLAEPGVLEAIRSLLTLAGEPEGIQASASSAARAALTREGSGFFALMRVDGFRGLADRLGPDPAHDLLVALRLRLLAALPDAVVGRVGGGTIEFCFMSNSQEAAQSVLAHLHGKLEAAGGAGGDRLAAPITLGFTDVDEPGQIAKAAERAGRALALAEASGARCAFFGEQEHTDTSERLTLMRDLRAALADEALTLAYQPKLNVRTGRIDGVEALVRWMHPVRGPVPPDQFIGLAEDTGDVAALTRQVVRMALRDHAQLAAQGRTLPIHINLSGRLVGDADFCAELTQTCAGAPGALGLEITETAVFADPARALRNLSALVDAGVPIGIDDYGSGLSSLAYLKLLPARELKIDKLFVMGLSSSHRDPLIVRSTIDLAHALEMEVTAEGVDDARTLALLRVMGCDRVQGFHISPPLRLKDLAVFLSEADNRDLAAAPAASKMIGHNHL